MRIVDYCKALQRAVVVRCSEWSIVEWTYEGGLKCLCRVSANGSLAVIKRVHMIVCMESGCEGINLGGTAGDEYYLLSHDYGMRFFFGIIPKRRKIWQQIF